ncbi:MAG: hypothetical protein ACTSXL_00955 [Alphaproteobacteria bacterium]
MQNIKRDGRKKQVKTDLEIVLATELGLLSTLKRIKFNKNPSNPTQNTINPNQTRLVDFHMEIAKKIDDVIQKHEEENTVEQKIVEPRTTWTKTPQTPIFKTEIPIDTETTNFDNELFELEVPTDNFIERKLQVEPNIENQPVFVGPIQPKNTSIFAIGDHSEDKLITTLGRIKINREKIKNTNKTQTKKNNGYSKAKNNYQQVQTELEKKKHELEEIERLAKLKEIELKKKEQERKEKEKKKAIEQKKQDKLKQIEQKKLEKEEKLKAKQELKISKEKERKKIKQDKLKQIEQKQLEKQKQEELKEKERLKELKTKELEKQKQKELKEQEKLKRLKEKEKREQDKKTTKGKKPITIKLPKKKEIKKEEKTIIKPDVKTTQKELEKNIQPPEDDLIKAFEIIDDLLGKLPEETIDEFVKSDDFEVYEKVVSRYKKK